MTIPSQCNGNFCSFEESRHCLEYNDYVGCTTCANGFWKKSWQHPCVDCQSSFGAGCIECGDWNGCIECDTSKYQLKWSDENQVGYCDPIDCDDSGTIIDCGNKPTWGHV